MASAEPIVVAKAKKPKGLARQLKRRASRPSLMSRLAAKKAAAAAPSPPSVHEAVAAPAEATPLEGEARAAPADSVALPPPPPPTAKPDPKTIDPVQSYLDRTISDLVRKHGTARWSKGSKCNTCLGSGEKRTIFGDSNTLVTLCPCTSPKIRKWMTAARRTRIELLRQLREAAGQSQPPAVTPPAQQEVSDVQPHQGA